MKEQFSYNIILSVTALYCSPAMSFSSPKPKAHKVNLYEGTRTGAISMRASICPYTFQRFSVKRLGQSKSILYA